MEQAQQPEALELAEILESDLCDYPLDEAAAELRRQQARIADLEAQLAAIGAGGVESLRKRDADLLDAFCSPGKGSKAARRMQALAGAPAQEHATQLAGQGQETS